MAYEGLRLNGERQRREGGKTTSYDRSPARLAAFTSRAPDMPKASVSTEAQVAYQVQAAHTQGRNAERTRWETVMLSSTAKGRERAAAAMLAVSNDSAEKILGRLAAMPTSAERARHHASARQAAAEAVWDRAMGLDRAAPASSSAEIWDKAIAATSGTKGQ